MKLETQISIRKEGRGGKRFYTQLDMAIIKHDQAILNSQEKRGMYKRKANCRIFVCGCGAEGCFIHTSFDNR